MSSVEEKELKAGHPPAEKIGGMRVARPRKTSGGEKTEQPPAADDEEFIEETGKEEKHPSVNVSGVATKEDNAFPPAAVKQFHEKTQSQPSKEMRPMKPMHNINQPR